jgi:hypothetical protein
MMCNARYFHTQPLLSRYDAATYYVILLLAMRDFIVSYYRIMQKYGCMMVCKCIVMAAAGIQLETYRCWYVAVIHTRCSWQVATM